MRVLQVGRSVGHSALLSRPASAPRTSAGLLSAMIRCSPTSLPFAWPMLVLAKYVQHWTWPASMTETRSLAPSARAAMSPKPFWHTARRSHTHVSLRVTPQESAEAEPARCGAVRRCAKPPVPFLGLCLLHVRTDNYSTSPGICGLGAGARLTSASQPIITRRATARVSQRPCNTQRPMEHWQSK